MDIMTDLQNLPGIHRKYCNIYEEQPGEGIGTPWLRLWKNA